MKQTDEILRAMHRLDDLDERAYALKAKTKERYDDLAGIGMSENVVTLARMLSHMTLAERRDFDVALTLARAALDIPSELSIDLPETSDDAQPERVAQEPQCTGATPDQSPDIPLTGAAAVRGH